MAVDEARTALGRVLKIPPHVIDDTDLQLHLPHFARLSKDRRPMCDLPLVHRIHAPGDDDGSTLLLLHGLIAGRS